MIWQVDFYRRPLQDKAGQSLWELLVYAPNIGLRHSAFCPQAEANANWLRTQFEQLIQQHGSPERMLVFRPQSLSLVELACQELGLEVEATRRMPALKQWLQQRAQEYVALPGYTGQLYTPLPDKPPPLPLAENLWGDRWGFATFTAHDLVEAFSDRPIPYFTMPGELQPLKLGLASNTAIPGVVITGGRRSLPLARWLSEAVPVSLSYVAGAPDGLVLEAGLVDRWIVATFDDADMQSAAQTYQQRKQNSRGLHFLLVQPDDSGITFSGFWLLQDEA